MEWYPAVAAWSAVFGWLSGWWVPALIRLVPEPESPFAGEGETAKTTYVEIGNRPRLRWQTAIGSAFAAGLIGGATGLPLAPALLPLVPLGMTLAVIDLHTRLLPRILVLPGTAYLLTALSLVSIIRNESQDLIRGLIGLVLARTLFWLMWRINAAGMGFGDVRLAALVGLALGYLGWSQLLLGVYAGFLLLGVPGFSYAVIKRDRGYLRLAVPFGPFMLAGAVVGIVLGPLLANYLGYT